MNCTETTSDIHRKCAKEESGLILHQYCRSDSSVVKQYRSNFSLYSHNVFLYTTAMYLALRVSEAMNNLDFSVLKVVNLLKTSMSKLRKLRSSLSHNLIHWLCPVYLKRAEILSLPSFHTCLRLNRQFLRLVTFLSSSTKLACFNRFLFYYIFMFFSYYNHPLVSCFHIFNFLFLLSFLQFSIFSSEYVRKFMLCFLR